MKKIIYSLVIISILLSVCDIASAKRKKKDNEKDKKEQKTAYQKLFDGKDKISADGLMKIHLMGGKVWVEFPLSLLGKDMALASSIEETSDNGEGVVGQFAGRYVPVQFTRGDSTLQMRVIFTKKMMYEGDEEGVNKSLDQSNVGGIFKTFKISAYTPDSTAVVVDMTSVFMEHSFYTNPFAALGGNSMFGFVERKAELEKEKSNLVGVAAFDNNVVVKGNFTYTVDHYAFGMMIYQGIPVTSLINKFLLLLPEEPMRPRVADTRIGIKPVTQPLWNEQGGLEKTYFARRWRLEPVDEVKYSEGKELVDVKKPIVFYMDTIFPQEWKPFIKAGVEEWNAAFEKIGFKDVVRVVEFPRNDPDFDANNIKFSTIRYASLWMSSPQMSMHMDSRTGEILNSSMYVYNNLVSNFYFTRAGQTMVVDPRVRAFELPSDIQGEMLRVQMMQLAGKCLGLIPNSAGSYAYPVDSLRSATFTQKYGISASVLDDVMCNYIAQPEDVQKGARLTPKGVGEYDKFAIQWLYQPILEAKAPKDEVETLNRWIQDKQGNPAYRFAYQQANLGGDPTARAKDLGDDHVKAMKYMLKNIKTGLQNYYTWFADKDKTMDARRRMHEELTELFDDGINNIMSYIGGIRVNEVYAGDALPSYEFIPKTKQKEAMDYLLLLVKDLTWMDDLQRQQEFEIKDLLAEGAQMGILNGLLDRVAVVELSAEKGGEYSPEEYVNDLYKIVWDGTLKGRSLTKAERELQQSFMGCIITTSAVNEPVFKFNASNQQGFKNKSYWRVAGDKNEGSMQAIRGNGMINLFAPAPSVRVNRYSTSARYYDLLLKTQAMLKNAVSSSSGETKLHYEYMLYKIGKSLEKKK